MTSKKSLKKKAINHGIACRIGNTIYYNKNLKKYPELFKAIMKHEEEHSSGFELKDIAMDLSSSYLKPHKREYYRFIFQNPSSLTELLPCYRYNGKLVWNPMILAFIVIIGGLLWIISYLLT